GVIFGPEATLEVDGSFHASTADYVKLGNNGRFDATTPSNSVLTTAPPEAFGFMNANPAPIVIQSKSLKVPQGKTFSLVGGDIRLQGGSLSAPSGQINIASVASPGEVIPNQPGQAADLQVNSFSRLGQIEVSQEALINVSGEGGGSMVIRGGQ